MTNTDRFYVHGRSTKPDQPPQYKSGLTQKEVWAFCEELNAQGYTKVEVRKLKRK